MVSDVDAVTIAVNLPQLNRGYEAASTLKSRGT